MHHTILIIVLVLISALLNAADAPPAPSDRPGARTVRVAVCQTFCIDGDIEGNLRRIEYAVEEAVRQRAAITCFPETALIGWVNPQAHELAGSIPGALSDRIARLAKKHGIMISIGLSEKDGESLYDSAILTGSEGQILLKHRKINILTDLMNPPYKPGTIDEIQVVDTPLGRVGMLICADTFKDELVEAVARQDPDLLIVPYGWAADKSAWPDHGKNLHSWISHTARRAGCPVVGTDLVGSISSGPWKGKTYGGQSAAADSAGEILGILRDRDAEVRVFEIKTSIP